MEKQELKYSNVFLRVIAKLIDLIVVLIFLKLFSDAGIYIGIFYFLISDGILKGKSIGKKFLRLKVISTERNTFGDFRDSILRNLFIGLSLFFLMIPFVGWIFTLVIFGIEFILMVGSPEGKRLGDFISKTLVIEE
jgi:uncharacterized RDD family membrane protein YckC